MKTCGSKVRYCGAADLFHKFFFTFFLFFAFFNAKLINHIILPRNVFFKSFFYGIRGFFNFDMGLRKKTKKSCSSPHTHRRQHRRRSNLCAVALWTFSYGVKRPPLSWLWL